MLRKFVQNGLSYGVKLKDATLAVTKRRPMSQAFIRTARRNLAATLHPRYAGSVPIRRPQMVKPARWHAVAYSSPTIGRSLTAMPGKRLDARGCDQSP